MTYIKFFNTYKLEEIAQKTHISPVVLKSIKDKKFNKFEEHKFHGFIKIIEREYNIELDDLIDDFEEYIKSLTPTEDISIETNKNSGNKGGYLLVFILAILIGVIIYYMKNDGKLSKNVAKTIDEKNLTTLIIEEKNETNVSKEIEPIKEVVENRTFKIIPNEKIWIYIYFLDDNSSKEYLTKNEVELNISRNQYIKFGHGLFTINFKDENISPNTQNIVRYLLIDGNISKSERIKSYE